MIRKIVNMKYNWMFERYNISNNNNSNDRYN